MTQNSDILTLENLLKEYSNTMILYKQAQENYNSALNNIDKKKYVTISGKAYWGTGGIQQKTGSSISNCTALCSNDVACKGATFDSKDNTCWTRSGNSSLINGTDTQSAIISELTNAALNLQSLNDKLLLMINQMNDLKIDNNDLSRPEIDNNYNILILDQKNIQEILEENYKIMNDNKNMELYNNQNRIYYTLYSFIAFVFVIVLLKMFIYPEKNMNWGIFILYTILAAVFLLLVHFLRSANIFFLFLLIIVVVVFIISLFR